MLKTIQTFQFYENYGNTLGHRKILHFHFEKFMIIYSKSDSKSRNDDAV